MEFTNGIIFLTVTVLTLAYDDLSKNKHATQSTTAYSPTDAYIAGNAVDRDITTCMRTIPIGLNNPDKTVWWKVDLGGVYSIYSVNILFLNYHGLEKRQRGRIAGFSLFVSNNGSMDSSSLCYKDGPQLPSLNFSTTCLKSGRYTTFYNERLVGAIYPEGYELLAYTEICEVIVQGCKTSGVYGNNCEELCPTNCRDNICHIQKGTCFGCVPGWTGTTCNTQCTEGWYGLDCKKECSGHCIDNVVCNHVTGRCDRGCAAAWNGVLCDKECEDGTFGNNCVNNCSGNCLNESHCNRQTGHCDMGCKPGYTNALCNEQCFPGHFGTGCGKMCSRHCLDNKSCDHIDGTCIGGCLDGFIGNLCNDSCREGYYGQNCIRACPAICKSCKPTDGTCSCHAGWMGPNCTIGCVWSYGEDCQYPCSKHCVDQTCDRFNGSCLSGCDTGYFGHKCDQDTASTSGFVLHLTTTSLGILGAAVGVFLLLTLALGAVIMRRKMIFTSSKNSSITKTSQYVEMENQPNENSAYQELTLPESDKTYKNLSLQ